MRARSIALASVVVVIGAATLPTIGAEAVAQAPASAIVDDAACTANSVPGDDGTSGPVPLGFDVEFGTSTFSE